MPFFTRQKAEIVDQASALPGRTEPVRIPERHQVLGTPLQAPFPEGMRTAVFGLGCFWGAERLFWQAPGVFTTAVGYAGGHTPNPTYEEVCSGRTGHAEVVLVAYDAAATSYEELLRLFFEGHDPTQGMRQGNDMGTQYRSLVMYDGSEQRSAAEAAVAVYGERLKDAGYGAITTELAPVSHFFYAEDYHQQYLAKNPGGYCPDHGTGIACPVGLNVSASTAETRSSSSSQ